MTKIRDEELIKAFGITVKIFRLERKITQEELASEAGIETRQIGRIERGEVNCTLSTIFTIAKALKIDAAELFKK